MRPATSTAKSKLRSALRHSGRHRHALRSLSAHVGSAQSVPYQRTFPQSKAIVEKQVKQLQSSSAGHLPALEGFTVSGDRPLDRFHRGYYQCTAQVSTSPSGGSMVRVNATITAWYTDPISGKSGYQVLPSNGRLEADFLDRLQEALGGQGSSSGATLRSNLPPSTSEVRLIRRAARPPSAAACRRQCGIQTAGRFAVQAGRPAEFGSHVFVGHSKSSDRPTRRGAGKRSEGPGGDPAQPGPSRQPGGGEERNTPVLANPIENAKVLFLAAAEDEFEMLDANPNWVHVRISGLSRGWIRRSSLEMPAADPEPTARTERKLKANRRTPTPSHSTWRMNRSHPFPEIGYRSSGKR